MRANLAQSGLSVADIDEVAHLRVPGQSPPKRPKTGSGGGAPDSGLTGGGGAPSLGGLGDVIGAAAGVDVDTPSGSGTFNAGANGFTLEYMPRIPGTDLIKAQAIIKSHKTVKKTGSNVSLSDMQKLIAQLLASLGPRG